MIATDNTLKTPPLGFVQQFVRFYFNHRNDPSLIETTIQGFAKQGYDMEMFYWCSPELGATEEDLKKILKEERYGFSREDIEKILQTAPSPIPDFKSSKVLTYERHRKQAG